MLWKARTNAPLLTAMTSALASVSVAQRMDMSQVTTTTRCDAAALATETLPLRHPEERRLVVLSCGGVATTYIMQELATSLAAYGYTTNCGEADMAHFKHRFPNDIADPSLMEHLYCYEPDRILYLFSDALPSIMSVHRRGHLSCGGLHESWDLSLWTAEESPLLVNNLTHLAGSLDRQRYDFLGRGLHQAGWAVANVPAPLLFVNTATVFADPSLLTDFLGVPRGVLDHLAVRSRSSVITPAKVPHGSPMRQMYANVYRQQRLMDRHLVVPEYFHDRLRAPAPAPTTPGTLPHSAPPPPLQCPALGGTSRTAVTPAALPGLLTPSRALMRYEDVAPYCGATWRALLDAYAAFHERALGDLLAAHASGAAVHNHDLPKVVVWRCPVGDTVHGCGGLADRLVGIAAVFTFALAFQRVVLFDMANASLPLVPSLPTLNWRFDARLLQGRTVREFDLFSCNTAINEHACLWNDAWPDARLDADVAVITTNRGFMGGMQAYSPVKRLGLSTPIAPMCIYHAVWRPAPYLVRRVARTLAGADPRADGDQRPVLVGVHFRVGDDAMSLAAGGRTAEASAFVAPRSVPLPCTTR